MGKVAFALLLYYCTHSSFARKFYLEVQWGVLEPVVSALNIEEPDLMLRTQESEGCASNKAPAVIAPVHNMYRKSKGTERILCTIHEGEKVGKATSHALLKIQPYYWRLGNVTNPMQRNMFDLIKITILRHEDKDKIELPQNTVLNFVVLLDELVAFDDANFKYIVSYSSRRSMFQNATYDCNKGTITMPVLIWRPEDGVNFKRRELTNDQTHLLKEAEKKVFHGAYVRDHVNTPKPADHVRFMFMSDTHETHDKINIESLNLLEVDVLIFGGDLTNEGTADAVASFNRFLGRLKAVNGNLKIVVIAGNHDRTFDHNLCETKDTTVLDPATTLPECTYYLQGTWCEIEGFIIYGTPWQSLGLGFKVNRGEDSAKKWSRIPMCTNILVSHGPPVGHGDAVAGGTEHVGCVDLLEALEQIMPLINVFGHVHEGYGVTTNGTTTFVNASAVNNDYEPNKPPIVIDVPKDKRYVPDPLVIPYEYIEYDKLVKPLPETAVVDNESADIIQAHQYIGAEYTEALTAEPEDQETKASNSKNEKNKEKIKVM